MNFTIKETTTREREQETRELWEQLKPLLLQEGYDIHTALKKLKQIRTVNTGSAWFKDLKELMESEGYTIKEFWKNNVEAKKE